MILNGRIYEPMPSGKPGKDRRRHPRWPIARACKLRRDGAVRFDAATTADVSAAGARFFVESIERFEPGQAVEIAVAWDAKPTIPHGESILGRIVRVSHGSEGAAGADRPSIAVLFDRPVALGAIIPIDRAA